MSCIKQNIMLIRSWFLISLVLVLTPQTRGTEEGVRFISAEHRLMKYLLKDYDKGVFPVRNASETVVVNFGLSLVGVLHVDDINQELVLKTWLRYEWNDFRLTWNPADFDGVSVIRLDNDKLWKPDISLYNANDNSLHEPTSHLAVVSNVGKVFWIPPRILRATCPLSMEDFPYDEHRCSLKFGSWTFDGFKIDLHFMNNNSQFDLEDYTQHQEYELTSGKARRHVIYYPCCVEPYPDLTFYINIKRRPGYYARFYVSPAVMMFLLIPFMFLFTPGAGRSILLGVGVMICSVLMITARPPLQTNIIPKILIYYVSIFIMTAICVALTIVVELVWSHSGSSGPPQPLISLVKYVGRPLHVTVDESNTKENEEKIDVRAEMRAQWKALSVTISRLLFIVFMAINIIITIALYA